MQKDSVIIASAVRTPLGNFLGELSSFSTIQLGATVIQAAVARAMISPEEIDEVVMGCVLQAGLLQAPARQAAIHAGLSVHTTCTTINKVCGSGMKAIMMAHASLMQDEVKIMVAGGMESMSNAPYLLKKARTGYRLGHGELYDHMLLDGLEDAYDKGSAMGVFAENCAKEFKFSRAQQDEFATHSFQRAREAINQNIFKHEILTLSRETKEGERIIEKDEHPFSVKIEKMAGLKPAFISDGTVTAGNSSCIADGAAALLLMREHTANEFGVTGIAKIHGYSTYASAPNQFTTAPIYATKKLLSTLKWSVKEIDLFELNEAFSVVALAFMKELNVPHEKLNIFGGAIALGHPIGASGARIVVTLIHALKERGLKRGIATLCIGGGEATAIAIELCE